MASDEAQLLYKIVVLGSGAVGKSCLTLRLVQNKFMEDYDPTIEDFYKTTIKVDTQTAQLDILDTAGQDDFNSMQDQWIREGEGFLLVYSVGSKATFDQVESLRMKILRSKNVQKGVPMVVVGNKCDLPAAEHQVDESMGQALADSWSCPFMEVSAKSCIRNEDCFHEVVRQIRNSRVKKPEKVTSMPRFCAIL